jgi:hypothetical protein
MADHGLMDVTELRDDALAFLQNNPHVQVIAKGSAENHWTGATAVSLAELRGKAGDSVSGFCRPFSRGG